MNDIKLKHADTPGQYDWSFNWNDLEVVRGDMQLINAVTHAVMLKPAELIQEIYQNKGCAAYNYIYHDDLLNNHELEAGAIETSAKSVEGVYDVKCNVEADNDYDINIELKIITDKMEELEVNEL